MAVDRAQIIGDVRTNLAGLRHGNLGIPLLLLVMLGMVMLPIPPFDGGHVVHGLLPRSAAERYARLARFGFPLVIFLIVILPLLAPDANIVAAIVIPPVQAILELLGLRFG